MQRPWPRLWKSKSLRARLPKEKETKGLQPGGIVRVPWGNYLHPRIHYKGLRACSRNIQLYLYLGIPGLTSFIHRWLKDLLWTGLLLDLEGPSLLPEQRALTLMPTCDKLFQEHPKTPPLTMVAAAFSICESIGPATAYTCWTDTSFVAKGHCWNITCVSPHFAFRTLCLTWVVCGSLLPVLSETCKLPPHSLVNVLFFRPSPCVV